MKKIMLNAFFICFVLCSLLPSCAEEKGFGDNLRRDITIDIFAISSDQFETFSRDSEKMGKVQLSTLKKVASSSDYEYIKLFPDRLKFETNRTDGEWVSFVIKFNQYDKIKYLTSDVRYLLVVINNEYRETAFFQVPTSYKFLYTKNYSSKDIISMVDEKKYLSSIEEYKLYLEKKNFKK